MSGTDLKCSLKLIGWNVVDTIEYNEALIPYKSSLAILPLMYFLLNIFILSMLIPTSDGLTCLSSPTIIIFLAIYSKINELISDWLASSTITMSNLFSTGFKVSNTLFKGIIQAGTTF